MEYINYFSKKKDKVTIFCLVFLDAPQGSTLCSLFFLIYIKSNNIVSTTSS